MHFPARRISNALHFCGGKLFSDPKQDMARGRNALTKKGFFIGDADWIFLCKQITIEWFRSVDLRIKMLRHYYFNSSAVSLVSRRRCYYIHSNALFTVAAVNQIHSTLKADEDDKNFQRTNATEKYWQSQSANIVFVFRDNNRRWQGNSIRILLFTFLRNKIVAFGIESNDFSCSFTCSMAKQHLNGFKW